MSKITYQADAYIIISDGQFQYPVLRSDVKKAGKTKSDLQAMNGDEYSDWCQSVPMAGSVAVGTQECIDLCDELGEAGAEYWHIA